MILSLFLVKLFTHRRRQPSRSRGQCWSPRRWRQICRDCRRRGGRRGRRPGEVRRRGDYCVPFLAGAGLDPLSRQGLDGSGGADGELLIHRHSVLDRRLRQHLFVLVVVDLEGRRRRDEHLLHLNGVQVPFVRVLFSSLALSSRLKETKIICIF